MISEQTAKDELKITKKELKKHIQDRNFDEALRAAHYIDFLDFVLTWKEE